MCLEMKGPRSSQIEPNPSVSVQVIYPRVERKKETTDNKLGFSTMSPQVNFCPSDRLPLSSGVSEKLRQVYVVR